MPVAVGLFDVLVALHREVPAPLSATVDHVAASPNLMIMVHIIQRLDVSAHAKDQSFSCSWY
jgi:hypothetical protein